MTDIPLHTTHLVERLLARYCQRICPPGAPHAVPIEYRLHGTRITLVEARLFCGVPGTHRDVGVAQFRYHARHGEWSLYHATESGAWRRHPSLARSRSFVALLREIDADTAGLFWGRLNGKSLRWCSARGRCTGCDVRYCEILGLARLAATAP